MADQNKSELTLLSREACDVEDSYLLLRVDELGRGVLVFLDEALGRFALGSLGVLGELGEQSSGCALCVCHVCYEVLPSRMGSYLYLGDPLCRPPLMWMGIASRTRKGAL